MTTFGKFIKQKRESLNLSQAAVASYLDLPQSSYSLLENGKRYWRLDYLLPLADIFGMEAWELVREWTDAK